MNIELVIAVILLVQMAGFIILVGIQTDHIIERLDALIEAVKEKQP